MSPLKHVSIHSAEPLTHGRFPSSGGGDAFLLEAVFRNVVWIEHLTLPISEENESLCADSMILGTREALAAMGGDGYEDVREANRAAEGSRAETVWLARLSEREVLESVAQFFEDRKGKLKELEFYQERRLRSLGLLDEQGASTYNPWDDVGNIGDRG